MFLRYHTKSKETVTKRKQKTDVRFYQNVKYLCANGDNEQSEKVTSEVEENIYILYTLRD